MRAKKRAAIRAIARDVAQAEMALREGGNQFHVISIRFSDGGGVDFPYLPWQPRTEVTLPGTYTPDDKR